MNRFVFVPYLPHLMRKQNLESIQTDLQSLSGLSNLQDVTAVKSEVATLSEQQTALQLTQSRLQTQVADLRTSHEETIVCFKLYSG